MKSIAVCLLSILSLLACNQVEKKENETYIVANDSLINIKSEQDILNSVTNTDSEEYFNYENTVLHENFNDSIYAKFSNNATEDLFTFNVPEGNINNTKSVLKIFSKTGQLIFEKTFKTRELVNGYDTVEIKNDLEMEKYILIKAKDVLGTNSFIEISDKNKIAEEDGILNQPKDRFENYNVFIECQNEKRLLFCIALGEEDMTFIGYSKKHKKSIDVIYCC